MDQANTTSEAMTPAVSVGPGPVAAIPMSPASLIAKLTLADKVIAAAAAVGIISTFLPAVSVSLEILGTKQSNSAMVIGDWRGKLGLLCFLAAGTILFLLIQKGAAASKNLLYGLLGACGLAPLLGIFLLIGASSSMSGVPAEAREMVKGGVAFGAYLFLLCGLGMAAGGFLKAKEQNLIPAGLPKNAAN
jgi:hypothetical protein